MSLSPQVDRTAGDKDESISTPPEHNYVVISKAPVASTADEPTTKMDEAKPDMMDESVTVAKDDSSASEALVAQADQAPTTGSDEVHRHDDVDMTEAHSAKPEDIEMTNSDPTDTTAPAGIDNTSSQTDAMDTSVPESPLEQSAQLPVKVELGTMPPSDAIEGMSLEKSDAAMDIDTQTVQQDAMDDVQTGGSPVIAPTSTVGTKGEDQDMRDAPQEKPALGSGRQVPSFGNTAPTGTPTTSQASTGFTFTPLKSTGISSLFAPAPSASPLFSSNGTSYTASTFLFAGASSSGFASQPAKSANFNIAKYRNTAKELVQVHPELHTDLKSILPEIIREQDTNKIDGRIRAYIRDATSAAELADNIQSALQMDNKDRFITETQYNTLKDYTVNAEKARKEAERQEVDMQGSGKQNGGKTTESVSKTMSFPGRSTGTSENFPTWSTKEEDAAKGPSMTDLLIKAKMNVNKKDAVSAMFASMFDISLTNPSDTEIIINYLASHLLFGAALADDPLKVSERPKVLEKHFRKAFAIIKDLVDNSQWSRSELIVWVCKEAIQAQDLEYDETLSFHMSSFRRQGALKTLFGCISEANLHLVQAVNPGGCLTWEEMKGLAQDEETKYFTSRLRWEGSNLPDYLAHMKERNAFWSDTPDMMKLVAGRRAAEHMATEQPGAAEGASANVGEDVSMDTTRNKRRIDDVARDGEDEVSDDDGDAPMEQQAHEDVGEEGSLHRLFDLLRFSSQYHSGGT